MDRVLIVEDDRAIGDLIADAVRGIGLEPSCFSTDVEAYSALPTLPVFAALVVDVNLGEGTTGFDVARFARHVIPEIPVVYVTGAVTEDSFRAFGVPDSTFVAKPFVTDQLMGALRSQLKTTEDG
jgi:DNA-binding response OmpR family regulator